MRTLQEDLTRARHFHGHLCHGMVLGTRLARVGCGLLDIDCPDTYRDLLVYVEMDRCATDAVSAVTGVTLGRRRLKWMDYGKFAATFVDIASGRAFRVTARDSAPHGEPEDDPMTFWDGFTDEQLFSWTPVRITVPREDLPGRPVRKAYCHKCHEQIVDGREVEQDGRVLCKACAGRPYYDLV